MNRKQNTSRSTASRDAGRPRSLQKVITLRSLLLLLPAFIILNFSIHRILGAYEKQMETNYQQSITQYTAEIDSYLTSARRSLYNLDVSIRFMEDDPGSGLQHMEEIREFGARLEDYLTVQELLDAFFAYSPEAEQMILVQNYDTSFAANRKVSDRLTEYFKENVSNGNIPDGYQVVATDREYYLFSCCATDGGILGCWFSLSRILDSLGTSDMDGIKTTYFSAEDGSVLASPYDSMDKEELEEELSSGLITEAALSAAPLSLNVVWEKDVIYQTLHRLQLVLAVVSVLTALIFIFYMLSLRSSLFIPLRQLTENIDRLGMNPRQKMERSGRECREFRKIYDALIRMTGEISKLKISVYEQELEKQKTQMELYQLQIRPHFFLNALNVIQCQIRSDDRREANRMISMLMKHCRYVLYKNQFVLVDEELEFVKNYAQLRSMQHGKKYCVRIECPEELLDYEIPVLIIQIPVENTLKYADVPGHADVPCTVYIRVDSEENNGRFMLQITVRDYGPGFPADTLKRLQDDSSIREPGETHGIGLDNIRRRIRLFYGDHGSVLFSNAPDGGAEIRIRIPVTRIDDAEDDEREGNSDE